MTAALLASALVATVVALVGRPRPHARGTPVGTRWRPPPAALAVPVGAALVLVLHGRELALGLIGVLVAVAGHRLLARHRAGLAAAARAARVQAFCEAVAAELAAGQPPQRVLERTVAEFPEFLAVATAADLGADVPDALRRLAGAPGAGDLRLVAAAWQVAHRSGAGLAGALDEVGHTVRERRRAARLVAAELAPAHATARMMAVLPLVFLLVGSGLGGRPVAFLTGTTFGLGCLGAGLGLTWAGLAWLQRIADGVVVG